MDPAALLREQLDALNGGISHAMVTIVEADGSTPRKNGKMLVFENGDTLGTIGGVQLNASPRKTRWNAYAQARTPSRYTTSPLLPQTTPA